MTIDQLENYCANCVELKSWIGSWRELNRNE